MLLQTESLKSSKLCCEISLGYYCLSELSSASSPLYNNSGGNRTKRAVSANASPALRLSPKPLLFSSTNADWFLLYPQMCCCAVLLLHCRASQHTAGETSIEQMNVFLSKYSANEAPDVCNKPDICRKIT